VLWNHYRKWMEDESVFVLLSSAMVFVLIPKRAFDQDQLALFREMLHKKIPG